jgi:hypothetical protein
VWCVLFCEDFARKKGLHRCIHARRLGVSSTHSPSAAPVNPHPRRRRRGT